MHPHPMTATLTLMVIFFLGFFADQVAARIGDNAWAWLTIAAIAYGVLI